MQSEFTARVQEVKSLMTDFALHIAACDPPSVNEFLDEPFVKDPAKNVADVLAGVSSTVSDNLTITRFIRWDTEENEPNPINPPIEPASNVVQIRSAR